MKPEAGNLDDLHPNGHSIVALLLVSPEGRNGIGTATEQDVWTTCDITCVGVWTAAAG